MFHGVAALNQFGEKEMANNFRACQIQERPGATIIPHMTPNSMFF